MLVRTEKTGERDPARLYSAFPFAVAGTPVFDAFQMYRNDDGNNGAFGSISVSDTGPNPNILASFASMRRSDGALTVMVISKVLRAKLCCLWLSVILRCPVRCRSSR